MKETDELVLDVRDDTCPAEAQILFPDHLEDDVIIPGRITQRSTFLTSWLLLVSGVLGWVYGFYVIAALLTTVFLTSILHWWRPRFSTRVRPCDFAAVFASIAYGCYFATMMPTDYIITWFVGIAIVAVIFIANEVLFYLRTAKVPSGSGSGVDTPWATVAGTQAREDAYWTTSVVHAVCVHVLANALVVVLLVAAHNEDGLDGDYSS